VVLVVVGCVVSRVGGVVLGLIGVRFRWLVVGRGL